MLPSRSTDQLRPSQSSSPTPTSSKRNRTSSASSAVRRLAATTRLARPLSTFLRSSPTSPPFASTRRPSRRTSRTCRRATTPCGRRLFRAASDTRGSRRRSTRYFASSRPSLEVRSSAETRAPAPLGTTSSSRTTRPPVAVERARARVLTVVALLCPR